MKNKFFLGILIFSIMNLSCSSINRADIKKDEDSAIENIKFGSTPEFIIKVMGEPYQAGSDEKSKVSALRYVQTHLGKKRSRENFVFSEGTGLTLKYLDIYDDDPESSLDFWRSKFPNKDLVIKTEQVVSKHSIDYNQRIEISPKQSLEIKNNKVVTIYWEK